jgi:hypothetical protein
VIVQQSAITAGVTRNGKWPMDKGSDKSTREPLIEAVHKNMASARAFAAVARSKFDQGNSHEARVARIKALGFCLKAHQSIVQIAEEDQKSDLEDLAKLRETIASLSPPPLGSSVPPAEGQESRPDEPARKVSKRWKFW